MLSTLTVVLPVFLIVGAGYGATRWLGFKAAAVDGLLAYAIRFAIPVLLFRALLTLDLSRAFDLRLLGGFYAGAFAAYALAIGLSLWVWRRRPGEAAAIGFCAMFSNTLLLGLPILERAYGAPALPHAYAIIALHAPLLYLVGITVMEVLRSDGAGPVDTARRALRAMFSNALTLGIAAGLAVNLTGLPVPGFLRAAVDLTAGSALPAALFGLGGALTRYALRDDMGVAATAVVLSTVIHPVITYALVVWVMALPVDMARAAVLIAAMPTGMNGYMFASMYNRAQGAAASTVLLGTAVAVVSVSLWLLVLEGVPG